MAELPWPENFCRLSGPGPGPGINECSRVSPGPKKVPRANKRADLVVGDIKCVQFFCVMGLLSIVIVMWVIPLMHGMYCFLVRFHLTCSHKNL